MRYFGGNESSWPCARTRRGDLCLSLDRACNCPRVLCAILCLPIRAQNSVPSFFFWESWACGTERVAASLRFVFARSLGGSHMICRVRIYRGTERHVCGPHGEPRVYEMSLRRGGWQFLRIKGFLIPLGHCLFCDGSWGVVGARET